MPDGTSGAAARTRTQSRAAVRVRAREPDDSKHAAPPLILIVDDVEDNRDLYATFLVHKGYRVALADNGAAALSMIAREVPALVLMDLGMPVLDGWEATRIIKSNPKTANIAVIVLTGFTESSDLLRARAAGADGICTKPCLPQVLLPLIQRHLGELDEP